MFNLLLLLLVLLFFSSTNEENSLLWCFSEIDFTSVWKEPVIPLMLLNFFLSHSVKVHVEQWTGHDRSLDAKLLQRLRLYECVRVHPVKLLLQNACPPPSLSNPLLSCLTGIKKTDWDKHKNRTNEQLMMSILAEIQESSDLCCVYLFLKFCFFCCWFKNFVLFTCTVNAVHPLLVGEIKKKKVWSSCNSGFGKADYCNPQQTFQFKLACPSLP